MLKVYSDPYFTVHGDTAMTPMARGAEGERVVVEEMANGEGDQFSLYGFRLEFVRMPDGRVFVAIGDERDDDDADVIVERSA